MVLWQPFFMRKSVVIRILKQLLTSYQKPVCKP